MAAPLPALPALSGNQKKLPYGKLIERDVNDRTGCTLVCKICKALDRKTHTFKLPNPSNTSKVTQHFKAVTIHEPALTGLLAGRELAGKSSENVVEETQDLKSMWDPSAEVINRRKTKRKRKKDAVGAAAARFVATSYSPFRLIENQELHELMQTLDVSEEKLKFLPTRQKLASRHVPHAAEKERAALKEELETVDFLTLQMDEWTSSAQKVGYVGICVSYIIQGERRSALLAMVELSAESLSAEDEVSVSATAEKLARLADDNLKEFGVREKTYVMVSDTTNTMPKIASILGLTWVPCVAHRIHLVVSKALQVLDPPKETNRREVAAFSLSESGSEGESECARGSGSNANGAICSGSSSGSDAESVGEYDHGSDVLENDIDESSEEQGDVMLVVRRAKKLASYFRKPKAARALKKVVQTTRKQVSLPFKVPLRVLGGNVTRWTSTFKMIERLTEIHGPSDHGVVCPLRQAMVILKESHSGAAALKMERMLLTSDEWNVLINLVGLEPLDLFGLTEISGLMKNVQDDDMWIGDVLTTVVRHRDSVVRAKEQVETSERLTDRVRSTLLAFYRKLESGLRELVQYLRNKPALVLASIVSVSALSWEKIKPPASQTSGISQTEYDNAKKLVKDLAVKMYHNAPKDQTNCSPKGRPKKKQKTLKKLSYKARRKALLAASAAGPEHPPQSSSSSQTSTPAPLSEIVIGERIEGVLSHFLVLVHAERGTSVDADSREFLNTEFRMRTDPYSVALWRAFRAIFVAPVSAAAPERLFSRSSDVIRRKRARLGPKIVDDLLFIVDSKRRVETARRNARRREEAARQREIFLN